MSKCYAPNCNRKTVIDLKMHGESESLCKDHFFSFIDSLYKKGLIISAHDVISKLLS